MTDEGTETATNNPGTVPRWVRTTEAGQLHQWVRTISALTTAIAAIAVALGVLTMAEESIDHTDLMNDQIELISRQLDSSD